MSEWNGISNACLRAHAWTAVTVGWAWTVAASALILGAAAVCERRQAPPPL